jgi:pantoate--beta-alanine ligase
MNKLHTIQQVREHVSAARNAGRRVGFVPTMGALHEGHRSLMRVARAASQDVVVSIFVNPTQFGPGEDFERYPRPLEADLAACREEGVDGVFCPSVAEMYSPDAVTAVAVSRLQEGLCGVHRPGHFDGVTTVVAKLFNIVQPDAAFFGQKDAQQAVLIRRMVRDLCMPVEVVVCPIVREADGMALSSRNVYLSPAERAQARSLSAALRWTQAQVAAGARCALGLVQGMRQQIEAAGPCSIDYIEIVDAEALRPKTVIEGRCLVALAVRIGKTRLIDNVLVEG